MISKAISAVMACFVVTAVADVRAAVIFSEIRTGAELATHPYVTFPTVTPTVSVSAIEIAPDDERAFQAADRGCPKLIQI